MVVAAMAAATITGVSARLAVIAVAVAAYAAASTGVLAAAVTAGLGYLVFNGFLLNRYGELSWSGRASASQVVILALAVGGGRALRWLRRIRNPAAMDNECRDYQSIESTPNKKESHGA
jgi:hypothetical protein